MRTLLCVLVSGVAAISAAARPLIHIDFDSAPFLLPQDFYSSQGLTTAALTGNPGPGGGGLLSIISMPAGLPAPAGGLGIRPYANLAGFLSAFEFTFATPVDYFSIFAFDGAQAVTIQAFRLGGQVDIQNIPAQPGRVSLELTFGSIGSSTRIDRVLISPSLGIGPGDPNAGPTYYDALAFNTIPAPAAAPLSLLFIAFRRRRSL